MSHKKFIKIYVAYNYKVKSLRVADKLDHLCGSCSQTVEHSGYFAGCSRAWYTHIERRTLMTERRMVCKLDRFLDTAHSSYRTFKGISFSQNSMDVVVIL